MSMSFGAYITKDPSGFFDDLMQVIDGSFERKDMVLENGKISIYNVGNNVRVDIIRKEVH